MIKDYRGYRVEITSEFDGGRWRAVANLRLRITGSAVSHVVGMLGAASYETGQEAEAVVWENSKRRIDKMLANVI